MRNHRLYVKDGLKLREPAFFTVTSRGLQTHNKPEVYEKMTPLFTRFMTLYMIPDEFMISVFKQHHVHFLQLWSHERKEGTKAKYLFYLFFMMLYLFNNKLFQLILTFIAQELSTTLNMIQPLVARGKCVLSERLAVILLAVAGKCSCKEDATPKPPSDGFGC